jgi:hypothetical protein
MPKLANGLLVPRSVAGYGWAPSPPNLNDGKFTFAAPASLKRSLPPSVDLRSFFRPRDQKDLGACTGFGECQLFDFAWREQGLPPDHLSSPLYLYGRECSIENHPTGDSGAFPRDGFEVMLHEGVCPEDLWPYDPAMFGVQPPPAAVDEAKRYKIESYHEVPQRVVDMQACLALRQPFGFGISCYESLESPAVTQTGHIPMPRIGEAWKGGHYLVAVGYDDSTRLFWLLNHWRRGDGTWWGLDGFGTIGYDYLEHPKLTGDLFVLGRIVTA